MAINQAIYRKPAAPVVAKPPAPTAPAPTPIVEEQVPKDVYGNITPPTGWSGVVGTTPQVKPQEATGWLQQAMGNPEIARMLMEYQKRMQLVGQPTNTTGNFNQLLAGNTGVASGEQALPANAPPALTNPTAPPPGTPGQAGGEPIQSSTGATATPPGKQGGVGSATEGPQSPATSAPPVPPPVTASPPDTSTNQTPKQKQAEQKTAQNAKLQEKYPTAYKAIEQYREKQVAQKAKAVETKAARKETQEVAKKEKETKKAEAKAQADAAKAARQEAIARKKEEKTAKNPPKVPHTKIKGK